MQEEEEEKELTVAEVLAKRSTKRFTFKRDPFKKDLGDFDSDAFAVMLGLVAPFLRLPLLLALEATCKMARAVVGKSEVWRREATAYANYCWPMAPPPCVTADTDGKALFKSLYQAQHILNVRKTYGDGEETEHVISCTPMPRKLVYATKVAVTGGDEHDRMSIAYAFERREGDYEAGLFFSSRVCCLVCTMSSVDPVRGDVALLVSRGGRESIVQSNIWIALRHVNSMKSCTAYVQDGELRADKVFDKLTFTYSCGARASGGAPD